MDIYKSKLQSKKQHLQNLGHKCKLCGKRFRFSKLLFEHQVCCHPKEKLSILLDGIVTSESYYSSDSDCDYKISINILKTKKSRRELGNQLLSQLNVEKEKSKMTTNNFENYTIDFDSDIEAEYEVLVEKLKCSFCPQRFTTAKNLKQHLKMYHVPETGTIVLDVNHMTNFVCPECGKQLRNIRCLKKHIKLCHNLIIEGLIYNSSHRSRVSTGPSIVNNELSKVFPIIRDRSPTSGKPRTQCGVCGHGPVYGYTTIIKHQVRKHGRPKKDQNDTYVCGHCSKEFGNKENLSRHMKSHENARRYHCDMCSARFNTAILLRRHKMLHVYIKCGICDKEFQFRREYRSHHRKDHPNIKKIVEMIQETTNNEIVVTNEIPKVNMVHFNKSCSKCFKTFRSKRGYKGHICKDHSAEAVDKFCSQHYSARYEKQADPSVETSNNTYTSEEAFCRTCNKHFKRNSFQQHHCKSIRSQCPIDNTEVQCINMEKYYAHTEAMASISSENQCSESIIDVELVESEIVIG